MVVGQWLPVTVGGVGGRRLLVRVAQQGGAGQGGGVVAPVGHAGLVTPHTALTWRTGLTTPEVEDCSEELLAPAIFCHKDPALVLYGIRAPKIDPFRA